MMVQSVPFSRTLQTARPPTPPRESNANSKTPNIFSRLFTRSLNSQADITPTSSNELLIEHSRKRVAWDDSHDEFEASAQPGPPERKPAKSILKPYNGNSINLGPTKLSPPHTYANLAAMLESVAQQLSGSDRDSKLDAYTTLSGVLKASENVPDVRALKEKMVLLLAFIKRDLTEKNSTGALDTTLAVNALILLSIFLHRPTIADSITTDFSTYLVEHAIKTFQDASMSKDIAKHLMLVLAEQKFSSKAMNADRVSRLIASLHDIESYVKGKSIVMGRISIYRTLLRQSKAHMLINTNWMHDLFGDLFSTVKDTKMSAITFGFEAALILGTDSKATRAFMELFSAELDDNGAKFGDYYAARLKAMAESKQDIASVPQIWSIPVLFLRSKPRQFEQWAYMTPWLGIVQQCFNSSDPQAKFEANLAWNRLVFALQLDEKTPPQMIKLLYQPLDKQLKRKSKGKKAALGSLCNLLYYSLKPASSLAQLDLYWDRYIVEAIGKALSPQITPDSNIELCRQDLMDACHILQGLFDYATPRKWSESRAVEAYGKEMLMDAIELPALDSKWLRKSASRVFPIINSLLEKLYWDLAEEKEAVTTLWKAYVTSIASPAIMEVKVSNETMSCVAYFYGFLYKMWQTGPNTLQAIPAAGGALSLRFLLSFESIISTTITSLGLLPFTEKLLSYGLKDEFVVIATPSHQPKLARGEARCPLHHLLLLLTTVSPGLEYDRNFYQMVYRILSPFLDARHSKRAKIDLILDILGLLPPMSNEPSRIIWSVLADVATAVTDTRDSINNGVSGINDQPLGSDYRRALKILETGVEISPTEPLPGWKILFEALVTSATIDAGDSGRAIAVIEPLGRSLQSKFSKVDGHSTSRSHIYFRTVVSKATYPKDRQAFDAARRKLWGTAATKASSFDPYNLLYDYMCESLEKAYSSFTSGLGLEYSDMITATTNLLCQCPATLLASTLVKLQTGISGWIKDDGSHIRGGTALSQSITSIWSKICQIIPSIIRAANCSRILNDLEILLCSGLKSRHRSIVNSSIRLWNSTFGASKVELAYPTHLKDALLNIHRVADIQLPFFTESLESNALVDQRQLPNYIDTQAELSQKISSTNLGSFLTEEPTNHLNKTSPTSSARLLMEYTPQVLIEITQSRSQKRSRESTPDSNSRKFKQRNVAPKLRHDDSQIQFQAIDSSPINATVLDSQLLTDRQREVKERQQADATMFPDLRSSPRQREKSKTNPASELPLHGSTSQSRQDRSTDRERETTPSLARHVEFDDYVNSSPTPTRSLRNDIALDEPSSSPPETPKEQATVYQEDEMDMPSSPPEIPLDIEMNSTSLGPSAQVDPYASGEMPTLSTFQITPDQQMGISAFVQSDRLESEKSVALGESSMSGVQSSSTPEEAGIPGLDPAAPGTPARRRESSPTLFQTPRSELFHDAQTSPVSSDKHNLIEDVFEDAVSSPRPDLGRVGGLNHETESSPMSYLDESSALRIVAGYDQGSGRPRRSPRNFKFASAQENENISAPVSSVEVLPVQKLSEETSPMHKSQAFQELISEPSSPAIEIFGSSPMPSLIPETPGLRTSTILQVVDGEEIDLAETIVVDDSILQQRYVIANKQRKRKSDTTLDINDSPATKKGRLEESVEEQGRVTDHQDAQNKIVSPQKLSVSKKRKGRVKRGGPVSFLIDGGSQSSPSRSFSSVDDERSIEESQEVDMDATPHVATSPAKEASILRNDKTKKERVKDATGEKMKLARFPGENLGHEDQGDMSAVITEDQRMSDCSLVADTILGETGSLDNYSSVSTNGKETQKGGQEAMSGLQVMTISSNSVNRASHAAVDASVQTEAVLDGQSFEGIKGKLQSIIGDLGAVSLSREEMSELEDLFMDAKEVLYGGRRRRARS